MSEGLIVAVLGIVVFTAIVAYAAGWVAGQRHEAYEQNRRQIRRSMMR